jgi:Zn-dependent peptidase ImmA (M78 family)
MSAVEILQSRMSRNVEARARAFAGEFLLPSASAARVWDLAGSPVDQNGLESVLRELADDFGVSISVAAWKLEHGAWGAPPLLRSMLSLIAPRR